MPESFGAGWFERNCGCLVSWLAFLAFAITAGFLLEYAGPYIMPS
jgi:hypothetical protein